MSTTGEGKSEDDLLVVPEVPTNINATSIGPDGVEPSSSEDEPVPAIDVEMSGEPEEEVPPVVEFDPRFRESLEGLMFIGKITKTFTWLGHTIILKSMVLEDMLEAAQLHKPYVNTVGDIKAWQSLMLAASVASVDGKPLPIPMSDDVTPLQSKFNYINQHWYPWTTDALYEQYMILDAEVVGVITAMGKV